MCCTCGAAARGLAAAVGFGAAAATVEINGHPPYVLSRHPRTWGLFMQSCWCVWTAFDMPAKGGDATLEDDALVCHRRRAAAPFLPAAAVAAQLRRAAAAASRRVQRVRSAAAAVG